MKHIPNMKEKTLRYPGHVEYIQVLKESGFFDKNLIDVKGMKVSPLEFTSQVLFKEWKLEDGELEMTVMRVRIKGINSFGVKEEITYYLYDEFDVETGISSMSRTTGYTATAAANMLLDTVFDEKGVFPPELVGRREVCFNYIMKYLNDRGVVCKKESVLN